jgi:hypothetical protein
LTRIVPSGAEGIHPVQAGRFRPPRVAAAAALFVLLVMPASTAFAQSPAPGEYDVKAVFLYNFIRYVAWPAEPKLEVFAIAVLGESDILAPLREIAKKKTVGPLPLMIRSCRNPEDIGRPQILFVAKSEAAKIARILKATEGADILTVGEAAGLAWSQGIAINFVLQEGAVKFEISEKALDKTRLKIGSQLMKLAILVDEQEGRHGP